MYVMSHTTFKFACFHVLSDQMIMADHDSNFIGVNKLIFTYCILSILKFDFNSIQIQIEKVVLHWVHD